MELAVHQVVYQLGKNFTGISINALHMHMLIAERSTCACASMSDSFRLTSDTAGIHFTHHDLSPHHCALNSPVICDLHAASHAVVEFYLVAYKFRQRVALHCSGAKNRVTHTQRSHGAQDEDGGSTTTTTNTQHDGAHAAPDAAHASSSSNDVLDSSYRSLRLSLLTLCVPSFSSHRLAYGTRT